MAHTLINFDIQQKEERNIVNFNSAYGAIRLKKQIPSIRSEIATGPKKGLHLDLKMA